MACPIINPLGGGGGGAYLRNGLNVNEYVGLLQGGGGRFRVFHISYPDKEVLILVVEDSSRIRPITRHSCACQKRGNRFVKQEMIVNELILVCFRHAVQWVVMTR